MQTLKRTFNKFSYRTILVAGGLFVLFNTVAVMPAFAAGSCEDSTLSAQEAKDAKCCDKKTPSSATLENCLKSNPIIKQLNNIVNFLSAGVGIVVVGSIIIGGIQYSLAGNNPQAVSAAKKRIQDTLIALIAFFFVYAFLQWLIPGPGGLIDSIIK